MRVFIKLRQQESNLYRIAIKRYLHSFYYFFTTFRQENLHVFFF